MMAAAVSTLLAGIQQIVLVGSDGERARPGAGRRQEIPAVRRHHRSPGRMPRGSGRHDAVSRRHAAARHRRGRLRLPTIHLSGAGRRPGSARRDARMSFQVDVWLRSSDAATTRTVDAVAHAPACMGRRRCAAGARGDVAGDPSAEASDGGRAAGGAAGHQLDRERLRRRRRRDRDRDHAGRGGRRAVRHRQGGARSDDHARHPPAGRARRPRRRRRSTSRCQSSYDTGRRVRAACRISVSPKEPRPSGRSKWR